MEQAADTNAQHNPEKASGAAFMLRALRHRNYRLFFFGNGVSLIGTWLSTTATSWLVYRLASQSGSSEAVATMLGAVRFAAQIPMSALAPVAGVIIDRLNRHHVLVATQALSMVQSVLLMWLTFTHRINLTHVVVLSVFQGLINAFDAPARQAFVVELVEKREDLPNAIALNSSMFNGARLLGPAIGGFLIAQVGEAACFAIDSVSYLGVLIALLLMRLNAAPVKARQGNVLRDLREGFNYAIGFAPVRALLLLTALISFTVAAFQTLLPIFTSHLTHNVDSATMYGFMLAAMGVGAFAGAIYLASRRTVVGLGKAIAASALLGGVAMSAFAMTNLLPLMLVMAAIAGAGMIVTFAASNTLLQTIVEDVLRGRLMSFFVLSVMGAAPIGSLVAGWTADRVGEHATVLTCGAISCIGAMLFMIKLPALRAMVRPIYVRKGIIPEVATGLATADRLNTADER